MAGDAKYDGGGDAARLLRPGGMFLRSSSVEFVHPEPLPWLLRDCDDDDVVVAAADLPEEASVEAEERGGARGDAGSDDDDGGIAGTERNGAFRVRGEPGAMRVVVPLPEKFMRTYELWAG